MCENTPPRFCVSATENSALDVAELARVAHLAAGFRIERSAVEEHLAVFTRLELVNGGAVPEQRDDHADVGHAVMAEECSLAFEVPPRAGHANLLAACDCLR